MITIAFDGGPSPIPADITAESLFAWVYGVGPRPLGLDGYTPVGVTFSGLNPGEAPHARVALTRIPPVKE